jgi:hypothetical protein
MKFNPSKWMAEKKLKLCSRGARSLWLDILCLMHDATPRGHLMVDELVPTPAQLAAMLGDAESSVASWLDELERFGVFSRTAEGVIYSRRMVRDTAAHVAGRKNGKLGGNPSIVASDISPLDAAADAAAKRIKAAERNRRWREKQKAERDAGRDARDASQASRSVSRDVPRASRGVSQERHEPTGTPSAPKAAAARDGVNPPLNPRVLESK